MNVTEAVNSRRSVRAYQDKPVDPAVLRRVLETAQRSPSGGNTQQQRHQQERRPELAYL